jgi:hypothetical protein
MVRNTFYLFLYISSVLVGWGAFDTLYEALIQEEYFFTDFFWAISAAFCSLYALNGSHQFFYNEKNISIKVILLAYSLTFVLIIYLRNLL